MSTGVTTAFWRKVGRYSSRASLLSGAALSVVLGTTAHAAAAADTKDSGLQEVIVTAQRRSQNLQDVPISIEVLSATAVKSLNVENFDDLIGKLPAVTSAGFGPGQANIYMRGLSVGGDGGGQGGGGIGSFPNVAIFLDDQSAQIPGRNLDLYAVDLQRVEILEGPQGTLFGSGAQGGLVRYITNKPSTTKYEATVDAGVADTAHGAMSENVDATINWPVIQDKLGLRLVVYDDTRGGYINNVPGTFTRQSTDKGIHYAGYTNNTPGPATPINSISNTNIAGKNINPVTYQGARFEALWQFNDNWSALISESVQNLDAEGVFYEMPFTSGSNPVKLPDLSVQLFEPSSDKDFFENTAWTVNGRLGALNLVYTGAYLVRDVTQIQDYTNYARGLYADYYQCTPPNGTTVAKAQCYSPGSTWQDIEHDTHMSHEGRFSTPDNWRLRAVGGVFYEDFKVQDQTNFNYLTAPGFTPLGPPAGSTAIDPNARSAATGFFNDITRGYQQYAAFASIDYDIIPKVLTATIGTRYFDFENYEKGSAVSGFGCNNNAGYTGPSPCTAGATNVDAKHLHSSANGFKSRANVTWKITPDIMVYYTWSQGYRPAGYNRKPPTTKVDGVPFVGPIEYQSDSLTNNEIGYKAQFFHHRLTVNGAFYQEDWNNVQDRLFDPGAFGNLAFTVNGPNYRVRGTEVQVTAVPIDGLTFTGGFAYNKSKQLTSPPITSATGTVLPGSVGVFGNIGDTLAQSPDFKGDLRVRYEFDYGDYRPFGQIGVVHSSKTHSAVASFNNFEEAPITTVDASVGVSKDTLHITAYVDNLTNERGQQFISAAQFVKSIIVTRPLTAGLKVSYSMP